VQDGLGRAVRLTAPPQRIASVPLASDEILLDLVGPGRLLGVTYLARDATISNVAERLTGVRADLSGNPELLISLDADLVVMATYSNPAALDQMLAADVPVFVLAEFGSLDAIRANMRLLGRATGTEVRAEALIAQMDARIAVVQARVAGCEPVRVLYYEPAGGVTYGEGSTVGEILRLAGAHNVAAELGAYPLIDAEFVLAADPDVVLLGGWAAGLDDPVAWFTGDPVFGGLRAVREGRVYAVSQAHLTAVSHYAALGVEDVARAVYPQAFAEGCAP
jgi:iron complex transport system substrate-binding protein